MLKTNSKSKSQAPDAPESNAGDDFHILWSVRKSLELLNNQEIALKAIAIEGVFPKEAQKLDTSGQNLLGVDITEYYGGENFLSAHTVRLLSIKI